MNSENSQLITIVDRNDRVIGAKTRHEAHEHELIHRIVTIMVLNSSGQILLSQRSANLRDWPLRWGLGAAGHVDQNEDYEEAAARETAEEVGLVDLHLTMLGKYYYERPKPTYILKRFNAVFIAKTDQTPKPNASEVAAVRWTSREDLEQLVKGKPNDFTPGAREVLDRFGQKLFI